MARMNDRRIQRLDLHEKQTTRKAYLENNLKEDILELNAMRK